jgi:origin recognition complex subunit 1
MYICGIPGTGKTACVMEVLRGLQGRALEAGVQLVSINALSLPSPQHMYSKLWERLTGQRCGAARALVQLEAKFAMLQQNYQVGG